MEKEYLNGPDQVVPADSYTTWLHGSHVKLRITPRGLASEPPISVPGLMKRTVAKYPDATALASKKNGKWETITFKEYEHKVRTVAKAFLKLGLERHHAVCILGFNSEEWYLSDLAAIFGGGYAAGIYTTNSAEACYHCLETSRANICVVQDKKQFDKILSIRNRLKHLKVIIQWEGPVDTSILGVFNWEQIMEIGAKEPDTHLDNVLKTIAVNECCTLVFTSGTTGLPKAVMLSHDNLIWDALAIITRAGDLQPTRERLVSFLPLSHVAAQVLDVYVTLLGAVTVYFANPDALKGSLVETLKEIRPTRFLAVPRVWEKMYEKMVSVGASNGAVTKAISSWARNNGIEYHMTRIDGKDGCSLSYKIARSLVFSKVKLALGLDECKTMASAAAPLSVDIKRFFLSLDVPIMDVFGMSEISGAHTLAIYPRFRLDSAGLILDGCETMFLDSVSPNGPGEICMRGRHVFMGYLDDEEKTKATIDKDGWIHSGDIGRTDDNNFLFITGRAKELLITAGGENVAPVLIEQTIISELPHISQAVVVGDKRKFLSVLVTIKSKVNSDTMEPLDELENDTLKWVSSLGSKSKTVSEIIKTKDAAVYKAIEAGIIRANKKAISNAQKIQKFEILPKDLSIPTGELGPTLKIKRNVLYEKYEDLIENIYKD